MTITDEQLAEWERQLQEPQTDYIWWRRVIPQLIAALREEREKNGALRSDLNEWEQAGREVYEPALTELDSARARIAELESLYANAMVGANDMANVKNVRIAELEAEVDNMMPFTSSIRESISRRRAMDEAELAQLEEEFFQGPGPIAIVGRRLIAEVRRQRDENVKDRTYLIQQEKELQQRVQELEGALKEKNELLAYWVPHLRRHGCDGLGLEHVEQVASEARAALTNNKERKKMPSEQWVDMYESKYADTKAAYYESLTQGHICTEECYTGDAFLASLMEEPEECVFDGEV